jgi:dGTPase
MNDIYTNVISFFRRLRQLKYNFRKICNPTRIRKTNIAKRTPLEEFLSDHSYIVFCTAFRRLQQKAQVFSLETDSAVRSRLTHSLEVADTGRRLAIMIAEELKNRFPNNKTFDATCISAIVENACLLHDIGNPPFGHFGEMAIKKWADTKGIKILMGLFERENIDYDRTNILMSDFVNFDGNPQGVRTILHLNGISINGLNGLNGLNLTIPTILSIIKYPWFVKPENEKKIGYFFSEKDDIKISCEKIKWKEHCKFPLMYIMEAADDICYALSDISDGIEKGVITLADFCKDLFEEIKSHAAKFNEIDITAFSAIELMDAEQRLSNMTLVSKKKLSEINDAIKFDKLKENADSFDTETDEYVSDFIKICRIINKYSHREANSNSKNKLNDLTITLCRYLIQIATRNYVDNFDTIYHGLPKDDIIFAKNDPAYILLKSVKTVCRTDLYRSYEAEKVEISGYRIITGLLDHFSILLTLTYDEFSDLLTLKNTGNESKKLKSISHDNELRVLSRISNNALNTYSTFLSLYKKGKYNPFDAVPDKSGGITKNEFEWWLRFHMIIDHISGMTDRFALETYQMFEGIIIN